MRCLHLLPEVNGQRMNAVGRKYLLITASLAALPWVAILLMVELLSRDRLSLQFGAGLSGFFALMFTAFLFFVFALLRLKINFSNISLMIKKTLIGALLLSPLAILLTPLFPVNLAIVFLIEVICLVYFLPPLVSKDIEIRIEPIFFLTVGMKVAIFLVFVSYSFL